MSTPRFGPTVERSFKNIPGTGGGEFGLVSETYLAVVALVRVDWPSARERSELLVGGFLEGGDLLDNTAEGILAVCFQMETCEMVGQKSRLRGRLGLAFRVMMVERWRECLKSW